MLENYGKDLTKFRNMNFLTLDQAYKDKAQGFDGGPVTQEKRNNMWKKKTNLMVKGKTFLKR